MSGEVRCILCRFFDPDEEEPETAAGWCRRHAPTPYRSEVPSDLSVWWPEVRPWAWCGEFERRDLKS